MLQYSSRQKFVSTGSRPPAHCRRAKLESCGRASEKNSDDKKRYGMIMLQGHGTMGKWDIETPTQIRFGQLTHDEYFVTADAAKKGVVITNTSKSDPIVMLKHFGENPDLVIEDED